MTRLLFVAMIVAVLGSASSLDAAERVLFQFDRPEDSRPWRTVNDGVMGGLSDGRISFNTNGRMRFFGTLSLANNGGFASTRASGQDLGLAQGEVVVLRVRGDGREYNFNLYAQRNLGGYSYRQSFRTKAGEWTEVQLPVDKFVATWRGRVFPNERLDPARVAGIGFQLGDKRAGPFQLEIDWIKVRNAQEDVAPLNADCDGVFTHHLQGVCADGEFLYWSFTTSLVKTDLTGKVLLKVPVDNHHGDLCLHEGKLYVAVNLGKFNDPEGNADSWVYVYDADSLNEVARHETQDVFTVPAELASARDDSSSSADCRKICSTTLSTNTTSRSSLCSVTLSKAVTRISEFRRQPMPMIAGGLAATEVRPFCW
jgi:hypothetical protein